MVFLTNFCALAYEKFTEKRGVQGEEDRFSKWSSSPCFKVQSFIPAMRLPIRTPMTEAIMRPRVHSLESPRQWRPGREVSRFSSIFTLFE